METPQNLKGLIEYQQDSVVSKTVIDKQTGTVTLFAFDEGQGLSEHTAPYDAMVYIVDGKAEVTISGKVNKLEEGEMIIMPANEPHALGALEKFKMMLVMIKS
ncbi:cupin domain-containing protein [Chloroflexota bacterium]